MAPAQLIKLEGPQPKPYIYPTSPAAAKIIPAPDYRVVNFNYLFEYATKYGNHRDRLPLWNPMKKSKHVDPWTGQRYEALPPILLDMLGQPAGWGISFYDLYARGAGFDAAVIGGNDRVLSGYRWPNIEIVIEWPCYMHYKPFKTTLWLREHGDTRLCLAVLAAEAMYNFLNQASSWSVDPTHRYWAPESRMNGATGINMQNMRLVALVNTHENHWRCDIAIVRPTTTVPSNCAPTMLDPVQYKFF